MQSRLFLRFFVDGGDWFLVVEGLGKGMRWFSDWLATEEIGESDWFIALAGLPQRFANGFVRVSESVCCWAFYRAMMNLLPSVIGTAVLSGVASAIGVYSPSIVLDSSKEAPFHSITKFPS